MPFRWHGLYPIRGKHTRACSSERGLPARSSLAGSERIEYTRGTNARIGLKVERCFDTFFATPPRPQSLVEPVNDLARMPANRPSMRGVREILAPRF
jgi:hypothetical protein